MTMPRSNASGFTLLELLVATSFTLVIVLIATTVLFQMIKTTRRINATMSMHAAAHSVQDRLTRETAAMHPCAAVWLVSDPTARSVELIFLRGKEHVYDFSVNPEYGRNAIKLGFTDLVWTRWSWTEADGILTVAESRSARQFQLDNGNGTTRNFWQIANNMDAVSGTTPTLSTFISILQPRRETDLASRPVAVSKPTYVLNQNSWKTDLSATAQGYLSADLGDYDDLVRNARPVLHGCSKLTIEVVDASPSPTNVHPAGVRDNGSWYPSLDWAAAGSFVDGGLASAGSNRGLTTSDRPGLIRIRFTLSDPGRTDASFEYSFSCRTPHPAPY
jgi:type II secretory pathway component PulJ